MDKTKGIDIVTRDENTFVRLIKDFFNPAELWGRQNRKQLYVGLICTAVFFAVNVFVTAENPPWNPFLHSSNGLMIAALLCAAHLFVSGIAESFNIRFSEYPWYEKYMATIITLLGLTTLMGLQNLNGSGNIDAALWINISFLLVVFIIAAGHFLQGSSHEKVLKIWFALLGYYFSVIVFFYLMENFVIR